MANEEPESAGPRLVWTFPLVTRIQQGSRFLDVGSNLGSVMGEGGVGGTVRDRVGGDSDSADVSEESDAGVLDDVENQLDSVREGAEMTFGASDEESTAGSTTEVVIQDGVFVPTRANIEEGGTVHWINESDSVHKISSVEGEQFTSDQLEPGEEFNYTFHDEEAVVYVDTIGGGENMSGVVVVGDAEAPDTLPSESEEDPVLFSEEDDEDSGLGSYSEEGGNSSLETRSMTAAAEEKDDMDRGFGE